MFVDGSAIMSRQNEILFLYLDVEANNFSSCRAADDGMTDECCSNYSFPTPLDDLQMKNVER